jgi:hypothetical protein
MYLIKGQLLITSAHTIQHECNECLVHVVLNKQLRPLTLYPKFFVNKAKLFDILVIFTYDSCKYLFSDISLRVQTLSFTIKQKQSPFPHY